jgi:apolipoprotein N-acyltransferase
MNKKIQLALVLCLTLGLAPFTPEPHIWGKLKWLFGGGNGMQLMDYFDLLFHGFPWIYLAFLIIQQLSNKSKKYK